VVVRLTVFGATGGTGTQVVRQALARGYEVTAVVRDPSRLPATGDGLRVVQADVMDPAGILDPLERADAVVSALGVRRGQPATVCGDGITSILAAMGKTGVRRLVAVSASGPYVDAGDGPITRYVAKPLVQRILREGFIDFDRMERLIRAGDRDWTIMRPPQLTNRPATGKYRRALDLNIRGGIRIRRADLATATLDCLTDPSTIRHTIGVAN
jgi:putative NADH-flavin reductase